MQFIADNHEGVFLSSDLKEYRRIDADLTYVVYFELLEQLKLPCQSLAYNKHDSNALFLTSLPEVEELDSYSFMEIEFNSTISPLGLFTYYILEQLLGNKTRYADIGLLRLRKNQLVFSLKPFDIKQFNQPNFERNWLADYVLRNCAKKDLQHTIDTFFILLNEKFKSKLLNAITYFQSKTGIQVNKNDFVATLFAPERLTALETFVNEKL